MLLSRRGELSDGVFMLLDAFASVNCVKIWGAFSVSPQPFFCFGLLPVKTLPF